jgi:predicted TIM-barrel fold metal-dependent hydrolase
MAAPIERIVDAHLHRWDPARADWTSRRAASNFPVDGIAGTFDDVYSAYATVTSGLDPAERDRLFAANAERVYRC